MGTSARRFRTKRRSAGDGHPYAWLNLVPNSGPFLSPPVLKQTFPGGLEKPGDEVEHVAALRIAFDEWKEATENDQDSPFHRAWIRWVLRETLGFPDEVLRVEPHLPSGLDVRVAEHGETLIPEVVIVEPEGTASAGTPRLIVRIVVPGQDLEKPEEGKRWKVSPATRMTELLRACAHQELRLGLVTNGSDWRLVHAPRGGTVAYAMWKSWLWLDERDTLRSFRSLLGAGRFFGDPDKTLERLFERSLKDQFELTDRLGYQVRHAVEILVTTIDRIDRERKGALLRGIQEKRIYEAATTTMMRLVFLLYAEDHHLLPVGNRFYDEFHAVSTLLDQLEEDDERLGSQVLERRHAAWARLLATFRAVHAGIGHDNCPIPPYGGSLFDPDRYPFLEGREPGSKWRDALARPLPIDDRTVMALLRSLQYIGVRSDGRDATEARRLSFKGLGVEQIGHVYESLLDHTAVRATGPVLGLAGAKDREPEIELEELEKQRKRGDAGMVEWLQSETGRQPKSLHKSLEYTIPRDEVARWAVRCGGDPKLLYRVRPYAGLVRRDDHGDPIVIPKGSAYVTQGSDRRSTGTHYTPPSLTEPIVKYTLEPLVYEGPANGRPEAEWKLRNPAEILKLKICDLAMGSAAFLVQTCRYLAERLVEAWEELERANPGKILITPEGGLAEGKFSESLIPKSPEERLAVARRVIADRCLYGVDKDPMAVEMAKLSLWLVTLEKGKPFTFLDHALKHGDSLLGISYPEQLTAFHLDPGSGRPMTLWSDAVAKILRDAREKRRELEGVPVRELRDVERKTAMLERVRKASKRLTVAGDLIVGAAIANAARGDDAYAEEVKNLAVMVADASLRDGDSPSEVKWRGLEARARELLEASESHAEPVKTPFHWAIEFPEVFDSAVDSGRTSGFDAFVGNPPFQGGQKITGALGDNYRHYLVERIARGRRGSADLCAYMFLRAADLLNDRGGFGLLATNTIAQGDTREVGLEQLVERGMTIHRAVPSQKWPGTANLEIAIALVTKDRWKGKFVLDGEEVRAIGPFLSVPGRVQGKPYRLATNAGKSFQGSIVLGMGFVMTPEEARALIQKDSRNKDVLYPYLNGEDLNSRWDQSPSRWVINFHDWTEEKSRSYPDCWSLILKRVKPERQRRNPDETFVLRKPLPQRYWHYAEKRPALYAAIRPIPRALVLCIVTQHVALAFADPTWVFAHRLVVYPLHSWEHFAIMQSNLHEPWARSYSSQLESRLNYSPTDCFETFPFPVSDHRVGSIGETYYTARKHVMTSRKEGLTATYNRVHDPDESSRDIRQLRELQVQLDEAVCRAYGWEDLPLEHAFHQTRQGVRYTASRAARAEILDRLLELNHQTHAAEAPANDPGAKPRRNTRLAKAQKELTIRTDRGIIRSKSRDLFEN